MTENEKTIIKDTLIKVRDYIIYNGLKKREGGICGILTLFRIRRTVSYDNHEYCKIFMKKMLNTDLTKYLWPPGEVTPRINWLNQMIYEELKDEYDKIGFTTCQKCGEKDNYEDLVTDRIDFIVTEVDRRCNKCNYLIDVWQYGRWRIAFENIE